MGASQSARRRDQLRDLLNSSALLMGTRTKGYKIEVERSRLRIDKLLHDGNYDAALEEAKMSLEFDRKRKLCNQLERDIDTLKRQQNELLSADIPPPSCALPMANIIHCAGSEEVMVSSLLQLVELLTTIYAKHGVVEQYRTASPSAVVSSLKTNLFTSADALHELADIAIKSNFSGPGLDEWMWSREKKVISAHYYSGTAATPRRRTTITTTTTTPARIV